MGIGASMVEHFAVQGSRVIFLDIDVDNAQRLIQRMKAMGVSHTPEFCECDLTDIDGQKGINAAANLILAGGLSIHAVINNAAGTAVAERVPVMEYSWKQWDASLNVNLKHQFFLTQALMPGLLKAVSQGQTASVINMGSISWSVPLTGRIGYTTAKAAVVGLTKTLAAEVGPQGVRVNSIMPGSTATEREVRDVHTPEYTEMILDRQAIKRLLVPADIARTALWLAADDSGGVTGQCLRVDGGFT